MLDRSSLHGKHGLQRFALELRELDSFVGVSRGENTRLDVPVPFGKAIDSGIIPAGGSRGIR